MLRNLFSKNLGLFNILCDKIKEAKILNIFD